MAGLGGDFFSISRLAEFGQDSCQASQGLGEVGAVAVGYGGGQLPADLDGFLGGGSAVGGGAGEAWAGGGVRRKEGGVWGGRGRPGGAPWGLGLPGGGGAGGGPRGGGGGGGGSAGLAGLLPPDRAAWALPVFTHA